MANEITTNITVSVSINSQVASGTISGTSDASNNAFIGNEQLIGTAAETIFLGDIGSTPVFLFVRNMDTTNYVEVDNDSGMANFPQKILPGKGVFLFPQAVPIYAKANTASCRVWVVAA
jgi:hypothetical protein